MAAEGAVAGSTPCPRPLVCWISHLYPEVAMLGVLCHMVQISCYVQGSVGKTNLPFPSNSFPEISKSVMLSLDVVPSICKVFSIDGTLAFR